MYIIAMDNLCYVLKCVLGMQACKERLYNLMKLYITTNTNV